MRLVCSLCTLLILTISHTLPMLITAHQSSPQLSTRSLDALLQTHAFKSLTHPKTGLPYDTQLPKNLTGIKVSALRLRTGSLRTRGFTKYKEFSISSGVVEQPYVKRLVLVYQNLGNWSSLFYPLPGYTYLSPVLGFLAYNGSDLSSSNLPELYLRALGKPIKIQFRDLELVPHGFLPKCVYFDLHGSVEFDNVVDGNVCLSTQQGHFSIVVETPSPTPMESPPPKKRRYKEVYWIIGVVVVVVVVVVGGFVVCLKRCGERRRLRRMEEVAEESDPLETRSVGRSRMVMAMGTRTRPSLENEYFALIFFN